MATHSSISCLENSTDREAWQATVHRVTESDAAEHTHKSLTKDTFEDQRRNLRLHVLAPATL